MDKNLINEIIKIHKLMNLKESKKTLLEKVDSYFEGKYDIICNSQKADYNGKSIFGDVIGSVDNDVLVLNEKGEKFFSENKYEKTIDQIISLKAGNEIILKSVNLEKLETEPKVKRRVAKKTKRYYKEKIRSVIDSADWKTGNSGSMVISAIYPGAFAVGKENGFLFAGESQSFDVKPLEGFIEEEPKITYSGEPREYISDVAIGKDFKTFPDNIITPRLVGLAKREFDNIVDEFVNYINSKPDKEGRTAFSKLTNITIQGQADSANPTWDKPSGYSSLDHTYGGKKQKFPHSDAELDEMNLFLAENRAKKYAELLIEAIKEKTGKEIKINFLTPISYRGQEDRRGRKWRSIILKANAPIHEPYQLDPADIKKIEDYRKRKEEYERGLSTGIQPIELTIGVNNNGKFGNNIIGKNSDGTPNAITISQLNSAGESTVSKVLILNDLIEKYNIPDEPTVYIEDVKFNRPFLTITNKGTKNRIQMINLNSSANYGNYFAIGNKMGSSDRLKEYLGDMNGDCANLESSDASQDVTTVRRLGTPIPYTVVKDNAQVIKYKGRFYSEITNYWFAFSENACKKVGTSSYLDYENEETFKNILNN